jgi:putative flippase GtrA
MTICHFTLLSSLHIHPLRIQNLAPIMRTTEVIGNAWRSKFIRFSLAGGIWTVINIGMMWLLIDMLHFPGWLGSSIGVAVLYVGRYYTYLLLKAMQPKFWRYVSASGVFSLFIIGAMTVAVDFMNIKALYASVVVTGLSFILKYLFFKRIKLIDV